MRKTKPFTISRHLVWEAYKRVKANKGSAGVDDTAYLPVAISRRLLSR